MNIDPIRRGIVLDHIRAGHGLDIYHALRLDSLPCSVAIIRNVKSEAMGRKDIIKIDEAIDIDLDVLGFLDAGITVNIIDDDEIVQKKHLALPERVTGVISCKNPRCITAQEQHLEQIFVLKNRERRIYRCLYCDAERKA